jgi:hypothetical protein
MADFTEREVDEVFRGVRPDGREDLAPVVDLASWLHASRELEPAPPMNDQLFWQIGDGYEQPVRRSFRHRPAHLRTRPRSGRRRVAVALGPERAGSSATRPLVSAGAAALLLVALVAAVRASGPDHEASAVASGPGTSTGEVATTEPAPTTTTTAATTTTTTAPPSEASTTPATEPSASAPVPSATDSVAPSDGTRSSGREAFDPEDGRRGTGYDDGSRDDGREYGAEYSPSDGENDGGDRDGWNFDFPDAAVYEYFTPQR